MTSSKRKATINDLPTIIALLADDELGQKRENSNASGTLDQRYIDAFHKIDNDPNQYLMVVELDGIIVGTCHLTIMPSLTFTGSTRMQIEAVRVHPKYRGKKIGQWMIEQAILYGKSRGASIIQLTTNKQRPDALHFYEKLGFSASHEGMKLQIKS
jgi:ribosomal protein S18 acetylase RimI-like enzyme